MATAINVEDQDAARGGLDQERSLILTFMAFAIILALSALVILGLYAENGEGVLTSATTSIASGITVT